MQSFPHTVLLVENDISQAQSYSDLLRNSGFSVFHITGGEKAIKFVNRGLNSIDLILMGVDLGTNLMDGIQAAREILKYHDLPILFLYSSTEEELIERHEQINSYGYVSRESSNAVILSSIKTAIKLHSGNTALKAQEKVFRENQLRLKRAEKVSKAGNWELHIDTGIMTASEGACSIYGLRGSQWRLTEVQKIPLPEYRPLLNKALNDLIEKGQPYNVEFKIRKADTGEIIDIYSIAEYDRSERILFGIIQNITERKRTEEIVKLLSHSVKSVSQGITITDMENNLLFVNQAFLNLYGYTEEEVIGKHISIVTADKETSLSFVHNNTLSGNWQGELINRKKDGTLFPVHLTTSVVRDEKSNPVALVGVVSDITGNKRTERELEQKNKNLEFLNSLSFRLAELPSDINLMEFLLKQIKEFTGATLGVYSEYSEEKQALIIRYIEADQFLLQMGIKIAGGNIINSEFPVSSQTYQQIITETVGIKNSFTEVSFGALPKAADIALKAVSGISRFYGIAYVIAGELFGTSLLAFKDGQPEPSLELLKSFAHLAAVSLRRKKAEDKLKDSEMQFRTLFDNAVLGLYRTSPDGRIIMVNQALCRMLGYSAPEELMKRNLEEEGFQPDYSRENFKSRFKKDNNYISLESVWNKVDGSVIFVRENARVVYDHAGNVLFYDGTVEDITKRKRAEEALIQSERKYRLLFENNPLPMWIYDLKTLKFLEVNNAAVESYGYSRQEFLLMTLKDIRPESDVEILMKNVASSNDEYSKTNSWRHRKKNGEIIHVEIISHAIEYEGLKARLVLSNDITERKKTQEELIQAKKEAEKSDKLKSEFLAQMSHEIRSPINTMLNFISLIKEEVSKPLNEEMAFSFNAIDSSSRRLIRTIDLILNMSQVQTGYLECSYQMIDLEKDILKNVINEYSTSALLKGLSLSAINECSSPRIMADSYTITQIFSNLVNNAIKYTKSGKIIVRLYEATEKRICVDVSDTGIGISEAYIDKIFTPFSQEEQGYTRKFEGNGLGLALVKKYCELNNAKISVKSIKGQGSTFTVTFNNHL